MDGKLNLRDVSEKMDNGQSIKPTSTDSQTTASKSSIIPDDSITGSLAEVTSCTEQIFTEDTELSLADISVNIFPNETKETFVEATLHDDFKGGVISTCSLCSVKKDQPKPLCGLLPSSMEASTVYEVNQSFTSSSKGKESFKTNTVNTEPDSDDLCAAILLACLFCRPLDCLLATVRGCNEWVWSLCTYLCGCKPTTLQPLLDITHHCDLCSCVRCFLCDCPMCDICLQATECLDLCMEISQMLYH